MKKIIDYFEQNRDSQIQVFQWFIYGWIILNTLVLALKGDFFWGSSSYIIPEAFENLPWKMKPLSLLLSPQLEGFYPLFILIQLFFCILGIRNIYPLISSLMTFFVTLNLDNKISTTLDGGNNIIHLMLIYLVMMNFPNIKLRKVLFGRLIQNFSFLMGRIQLCLLYFVAGHLKLSGDLWPKGMALFYTFGIPEYSHPILQSLMNDYPIFSVLGSYGTLAFQLSFPFLIWVKKLRPTYMIVGTFLHLGISFGMGLVFFGFAMVACYSIFYSKEKSEKLIEFFRARHQIFLGLDENCSKCQSFGKALNYISFGKRFICDKARNPTSSYLQSISLENRLNALYLYDSRNQRFHYGMQAMEKILSQTILFPIAYVLKILNQIGIGEVIYQKFFAKALWRQRCSEKGCLL